MEEDSHQWIPIDNVRLPVKAGGRPTRKALLMNLRVKKQDLQVEKEDKQEETITIAKKI
jgi:hypothetical protein